MSEVFLLFYFFLLVNFNGVHSFGTKNKFWEQYKSDQDKYIHLRAQKEGINSIVSTNLLSNTTRDILSVFENQIKASKPDFKLKAQNITVLLSNMTITILSHFENQTNALLSNLKNITSKVPTKNNKTKRPRYRIKKYKPYEQIAISKTTEEMSKEINSDSGRFLRNTRNNVKYRIKRPNKKNMVIHTTNVKTEPNIIQPNASVEIFVHQRSTTEKTSSNSRSQRKTRYHNHEIKRQTKLYNEHRIQTTEKYLARDDSWESENETGPTISETELSAEIQPSPKPSLRHRKLRKENESVKNIIETKSDETATIDDDEIEDSISNFFTYAHQRFPKIRNNFPSGILTKLKDFKLLRN